MDPRAVAEQAVAEAMNRVLAAEREAAAAIEAQVRDSERLLEAAREQRRRILETARHRAARVHAAAATLRDRELGRLDQEAQDPSLEAPGQPSAVSAAVQRLAAALTTNDAGVA